MKKLLTLVVAIAMIFALAVPTFAHEDGDIACPNHIYVEETGGDDYFWYWRIWCPNCGHTYEYESGYYR